MFNRSFHQLKEAQRDYQDWSAKTHGFEDLIKSEMKNNKNKCSAQGLDDRCDFPYIEI